MEPKTLSQILTEQAEWLEQYSAWHANYVETGGNPTSGPPPPPPKYTEDEG